MSEISEMPMIEQSEIGKIQPKVEQKKAVTADTLVKSADATFLGRLKLVPEKARNALRLSTQKAALTASTLSILIASGCGNFEKQNAPPPPTPTPAVSELPTGMPSATIEFTRTPPPTETPAIPTPTPTLEASSESPQPPQQQERKELMPYSPSISIIDAAPSVPTEGLIQKEYISNDEMIRNMLGDKYISKEQLIQEFGENYEDKWDEVVSKYPQALVYRLVDQYFNHGEKVTRVMEHTLERSGFESSGVTILPLQRTFDADSIKFIKDSSGNPGVSLNFDPKRIIKLLENDPSRVINGSFQVGNVELFQETRKYTDIIPKYDQDDPRFSSLYGDANGSLYPGAVSSHTNSDGSIDFLDAEGKKVEPISSEELEKRKLSNSEVIEHKSTKLTINGAYSKEKAMENLPKLFEVANAYPDKFFVFALGNEGEDIREAMTVLKDKVPNNLLIVGEWIKYDYGFGVYEGPSMEYGKYGQILGPDIYVYNEGSKSPHGSSFSAPEISIEVELLLKKGLSFEQAKEAVLAKSDLHTLSLNDGTHPTVRVFNPSKIQEK